MKKQAVGDNFRDAKNLGKLANRAQFNGTLSKSNEVDFFKVNLPKNRSVSASLGKLKSNASLQLFDRTRSVVDQANVKKGGKGRGILRNLERGLYYIRVSLTSGKKSPYQLQLSTDKPRPEPGNDPKKALNIGRLRGTYTDKRAVNDPNPNRFYRFKLSQITDLETSIVSSVGSTQANLIFDANRNRKVDNGEVVRTAFSTSSSGSTVTLPKGTYYMQVQPRFSSIPTDYELKMVATPNPGNLGNTAGGDSVRKPQNIGSLDKQKNGTFLAKDYVGTLDGADVLKFNIKDISSVQMKINSPGATQAQLIFDANRNRQIDSGEVLTSTNNTFSSGTTQVLTPGTYYVQVSPRFSSVDTKYDLSLVSTPIPGNLRRDPGSTLATSFNAGILNELPGSTFIARDYVGVQDPADVFKFQLTETRDVNLRINSGRAAFRLIFDANGNGLVDSGETIRSGNETFSSGITQALAAGTYYVEIVPRFSSSSSDYELIMAA
jgi:hypothetical protein